jgi:hypothetical protein
MPVKISIEADSLDMVQAMLLGMTRAIAEETGPAALPVQAELPLCQTADAVPLDRTGRSSFPQSLVDGLNTVFPQSETDPEPVPEAVPEPKRRGRKPKIALVEDVEPPPEVLTEEDEAEAEGAVDTPEPEPETTGISEAQLREVVRNVMDTEGIPAALALLAKGGYKHVKDIPPADYDRIHAIVKAGARHAG